MLREAKRRALEQDIANVEWVQGGSDDLHRLQPVLGRFDLVTIGTPFHFMEPRATLGDLSRIAADGAVVVAYNGSPDVASPRSLGEVPPRGVGSPSRPVCAENSVSCSRVVRG